MFFFGRHSIFRMIFGFFFAIMMLRFIGGLIGFIAVLALLGIGIKSFVDEYNEKKAEQENDTCEAYSYTEYNEK